MKKSEQKDKNLGERFKRKAKALLILFWSMFKIGLFTFGGGYAMIHLLENEFVAKKKWLDNDEFFDLITIAESTPGPVAINSSTYIGYKTEGFVGSLVATTAMCLPSFIIIFVISLFFNTFLKNQYVSAAFQGIQVCAVFLIMCAGIKMAKKIKFNLFNGIIFAATFLAMILVSIFGAKFSSIFYILISGGIGLFIYSTKYFNDKIKAKKALANNVAQDTTNEENQDNITKEIASDRCNSNVIDDSSVDNQNENVVDKNLNEDSNIIKVSTNEDVQSNNTDNTATIIADIADTDIADTDLADKESSANEQDKTEALDNATTPQSIDENGGAK